MPWFSSIILAGIVLWQNWILYKERRRNDERHEKLTDSYATQNEIYFTRCLAEIHKDDSLRASHNTITPTPKQQLETAKLHNDLMHNRLGRRNDEIESELAALNNEDGA